MGGILRRKKIIMPALFFALVFALNIDFSFAQEGNLGDVNNDGVISSYDTSLVSRHAAGRITLTVDQLSRADVNADGIVTQADADMIAKYVVGLIDGFGFETVTTPQFSPAGGTYSSSQSVTISTATSRDIIHYTINGSEPTQSSPTYTAPVTISTTTTIKAKAWKAGMNPSKTASATYTITSSSFRFIAWSDTESGNSVLRDASKAVNNFDPDFTIYPGDLVKCTASASCWSSGFPAFKTALNGGGTNDMYSKTFATRGNHEASTDTPWKSSFEFKDVASGIGASHYSALATDMTYSFDYGNAHFVGVDMTGGDNDSMTSAQITWLDNDLTAAEDRGLTHAFLFWHGPIYPVGKHCCSEGATAALITVLKKHPIISATFHGHEMVLTYTHIDSGRISAISSAANEFEQFVVGNVGDGKNSFKSNRVDYGVDTTYGFVLVDVNGNTFTVKLYKVSGTTATLAKTYNFTN